MGGGNPKPKRRYFPTQPMPAPYNPFLFPTPICRSNPDQRSEMKQPLRAPPYANGPLPTSLHQRAVAPLSHPPPLSRHLPDQLYRP